jgi:hypothetical protein
MASVSEVLRHYPLMAMLLILVPLVGGVLSGAIGAYLGYDNLNSRLQREQQQHRIEARLDAIRDQSNNLAIPIESLRRYEAELQAQGQNFDVLRRVVAQFDQLRSAITQHERRIAREDSQERIAAAEHILNEVRALIGSAQTVPGPGGQALIIKTAPNTFRVTFAVPMRIPPELTFQGLPAGATAHVVEKSKIGFTVLFAPTSIPVDRFGFVASVQNSSHTSMPPVPGKAKPSDRPRQIGQSG